MKQVDFFEIVHELREKELKAESEKDRLHYRRLIEFYLDWYKMKK